MKYFHVGSDFELTKKPKWLDDFRNRFDEAYPYHITFKTNTKLESGSSKELGKAMEEISKKFKPIKVVFNGLLCNATSKGGCFMIPAEKNEELWRLQQMISKRLSMFGEHATKEYEAFEKDFRPHITIARKMNKQQEDEAKKSLGKDFHCEAIVGSLTLSVMNELNFKQSSDQKNKTYFKFSGNEQ